MSSAGAERTIAYVPFDDDRIEKGYTARMRELLGAFGEVVPFEGAWVTWRRHRRRLDWLVLNWSDNELLDRATKRVAARKIVKLFAKTLLLRLATRRLAFVRHNVYPHATAAGDEGAARRWVDRYENLFDAVFVHSGDAAQRARHYCPHPLYHRVAGGVAIPALPSRYFVAFGRIVRYKRLERLIAAWPPDETLLIIGVVGDRAYADELAAGCPPNVLFRPGPIAEADAQAIVADCAGLVIAHADPDVIVSSSFFFAMSLGSPVIAVATPFLRWAALRLDDGLVCLTPDIAGLAGSLPRPPRRAATDGVSITREFGDAAVVAALRRGLGLEDRPARPSRPASDDPRDTLADGPS